MGFTVSSFKPVERVYNGTEQKLGPSELVVADKQTSAVLKEGTDYILSYPEDIVSAGIKKVTVIGIGRYNTSVTKSYRIKALKASGVSVNVITPSVVYHPGKNTTEVSVSYKGTELIPNVDYRLTYSKNKGVGNAELKVAFIGNYKGTETIQKYVNNVKPGPACVIVTGLGEACTGQKKERVDAFRNRMQYEAA